MIVECYSANTYCDCRDHPYLKPGCFSHPDVFTGRNKRETDRARRQVGWIRVNGRDVCPICKVKKPVRFYNDKR
jgi:hypothetical protein